MKFKTGKSPKDMFHIDTSDGCDFCPGTVDRPFRTNTRALSGEIGDKEAICDKCIEEHLTCD